MLEQLGWWALYVTWAWLLVSRLVFMDVQTTLCHVRLVFTEPHQSERLK